MSRSEVRYARSGEINIAYQVTGDGPFDLVLVPGFISHLELDWAEPRGSRMSWRPWDQSRVRMRGRDLAL